MRVLLIAPLFGLSLLGCGEPQKPPAAAPGPHGPGPGVPGPSGAATLVGAYRAAQGPKGPLACPFEFEPLGDGSVELNYLADETPQLACVMHRLPYWVSGEKLFVGTKDRVERACLHRFEGETLLLDCEDGPVPPPAFRSPFRLSRVPNAPGPLVGRFLFGAIGVEIRPDGTMVGGPFQGKLTMHDALHATLARQTGAKDLCLYRATGERLTLRCQPEAAGAPTSFVGTPPAVVLVRWKQ